MSGHSLFAPSGAAKWTRCAGSLAMEHGEPDTANDFTDEGTAAHHLHAVCLLSGEDAAAYSHAYVFVYEDGSASFRHPVVPGTPERSRWLIDDEFAAHVQVSLDYVRRRLVAAGEGALLLVEQRVDLAGTLGIPGQGGTADVTIVSLVHGWAEVIDLKFGRGVQVYASYWEVDGDAPAPEGATLTLPNEQLALYWLGAVDEELQLLYGIDKAILTITQPRVGEDGWIDSAPFSLEQMTQFAKRAHDAAQAAAAMFERTENMVPLPPEEWTPRLNDEGSLYAEAFLSPSTKACRWCKAKVKEDGTECPKLKAQARDEVFAGVEDFSVPADVEALPLAGLPSPEKLDLIELFYKALETYVKAARSRIQKELLAGHRVPLWKLVAGKLPARKWKKDVEAKVQKVLKKLGIGKEVYMTTPELLTPPALEKKKIDMKQFAEFIEQGESGHHIAPVTDEREEIVVKGTTAEEFEDLSADDGDGLL